LVSEDGVDGTFKVSNPKSNEIAPHDEKFLAAGREASNPGWTQIFAHRHFHVRIFSHFHSSPFQLPWLDAQQQTAKDERQLIQQGQ
jgi:hypothetical protein